MAKDDQTKEASATGIADSSVASTEQNQKLEHVNGGATTRDDATDLGVPMLPGSPKERVGPEDALGEGPKRGDYTGRLGDANYKPHEIKGVPDAKEGQPKVQAVAQAPRAEDISDVEAKKGGVETAQ